MQRKTQKCLQCGSKEVYARGLCRYHNQATRRRIRLGIADEQALIEQGLILERWSGRSKKATP